MRSDRALAPPVLSVRRFADAVALALAAHDAASCRVLVAVLDSRRRLEALVLHDGAGHTIEDLARQGVLVGAEGAPYALVCTVEPVPPAPPEDRVHAYRWLRAEADAQGTRLLDWLMVDEVNLRSMAFTVSPAGAWPRRADRRRPRRRPPR